MHVHMCLTTRYRETSFGIPVQIGTTWKTKTITKREARLRCGREARYDRGARAKPTLNAWRSTRFLYAADVLPGERVERRAAAAAAETNHFHRAAWYRRCRHYHFARAFRSSAAPPPVQRPRERCRIVDDEASFSRANKESTRTLGLPTFRSRNTGSRPKVHASFFYRFITYSLFSMHTFPGNISPLKPEACIRGREEFRV